MASPRKFSMQLAPQDRRDVLTAAWRDGWHKGHCGDTVQMRDPENQCMFDTQGALTLPAWAAKSWHSGVDWCTNQCTKCDHCRFVSVSLFFGDCSWYAHCDLTHLLRPPTDVWADFVSLVAPINGTIRRPRTAARYPHALSRRARRKLALLVAPESETAWLQPTAHSELALVLYGKIGTLRVSSTYTPVDGGEAGVVRQMHAAYVRNLREPNPRVNVDVFAHSWTPSLGALVDSLFAPAWSVHEREHLRPNARSAAASFAAALRAKAQHERQRGRRFDLVVSMRYDAILLTPLLIASLPRAQLWFPARCCTWRGARGEPVYNKRLAAANARVTDTCLVPGGGLMLSHCRVSQFAADSVPAAEAEM